MIDYNGASESSKVIVGYSDITALQFAMYKMCGWRSVSSSLVAVEWSETTPEEDKKLWSMLRGEQLDSLLTPIGLEVMTPGHAEGVLIGGNLSTIARLIGTPYLPNLSGSILFVEEIGEPPYRIDALFAQLKHAGILDSISGLLLGGFTDADDRPGKPTLSVDHVISDYVSDLKIPVVKNIRYGHFHPKDSLPIGVKVDLDAKGSSVRLSMLEPLTGSNDASGKKRVAVFASGGGSNFEALCNYANPAYEIALCITNRKTAGVRDRARRLNVPCVVIDKSRASTSSAYGDFLLQQLEKFDIELIALAGFLKMIPGNVVERYRHRILNIHPALLPSFGGKGMYGRRVHESVLAHGCTISGATVHLVDEEYDTGPILAQESVPVLATDTPDSLASRVLGIEHTLYPRVLAQLAQSNIQVIDGRASMTLSTI